MTELTVPKRRLGAGGPEVPVYALGSWNTWDRMTPDQAVALIECAVQVGCAFFDVAHYNMGPHEEHSRTDILFGQAIRSAGLRRDSFQVCGKLWLWEHPKLDFRTHLETSLERAGLDYFDMVVVGDYFGQPDFQAVTAAVNALIAEGLIRTWGINNWIIGDTRTALDFAKANGLVPPSFAQLKYSVVRRTMAEGRSYAPLFASGELGLQASDCLEGGILAGKGKPGRKIGADVGSIREQIYAAVPELTRIAAQFDATQAQAALAFCLAHSATANLLFGASRMEQFEDNLVAIALAERFGSALREQLSALWLDGHVPEQGGF